MRKFKILTYLGCLSIAISSCIKDDFVIDNIDPVLRITNRIDSIQIGTTFQFNSSYLNNVGQPEEVTPEWFSGDNTIIQIDQTGLASAIAFGAAPIYVQYNTGESVLIDSLWIAVGENTVESEPKERTGTIEPSSFYPLAGDFTLSEEGDDLKLVFADNYMCDNSLPGVYIYLTNNPATNAGALEISEVTVFEGTHEYLIPDTGIDDYSHVLYFCKPFSVKVGDGIIND